MKLMGLLLIACVPLFGGEIGWDCFKEEALEGSSYSSTEGLLPSVIANHVSAISGEYVDHATDFVLTGPEPFALQRSYSSHPSTGIFGFESLPISQNGKINGFTVIFDTPRYLAWQFNCFSTLYFQSDSRKHVKHVDLSAFVPHAFFSQMLHKEEIKLPSSGYKKKSCCLSLHSKKGVTNCGLGAISAKTNPKNVKACFSDQYKTCDVAFGTGEKRHYACCQEEYDPGGEVGIFKYKPLSDKKPNGAQVIYDKPKARVLNASGITEFSWMQMKWKSKTELHVENSHFDPSVYHFKIHQVFIENPYDKQPRLFLTKLTRPNQPEENYEYTPAASQETWLLHKKKLPQGRSLEIDYYKLGDQPGTQVKLSIQSLMDPRVNRVKTLKAPVGADATPLVTHQFFYDLDFKADGKHKKTTAGKGMTTVLDAYGRKTLYLYNQNHRLQKMISFLNGKPYAQTCYLWNEEEEQASGNLMGKVIKDEKDENLTGRFFDYDKMGNILSEKFYGNLTGKCEAKLILDKEGRPLKNGIECYEKNYTYSQCPYNLLLKEMEANGKGIAYRYYPESNLVAAKYLLNNDEIWAREFYFYDENHALEKKISDDGKGWEEGDLSFVTERRATFYNPRKTIPVGVPECIEEYAIETGLYKLLKKTEQHFSNEGHLLKQAIYDANGLYRYTLEWEYDKHGNMTKEVNALGHSIQREYDENDNLIIVRGPSPEFYTRHTYDFMNRRISSEEIHLDGTLYHVGYRYDLLGNCIAKIDRSGNETTYLYDDLNRLIATKSPPTIGKLPGETLIAYDHLGNRIEETDSLGNMTKKAYNAYGKPISILHPDGQLECFEYHLDGSLAKKIASNGTETHFEADSFGRIIKESCVSQTGELLFEVMHTYNRLHRTSTTDACGTVTFFTYDQAGRLMRTKCLDKVEGYFYDSLGRLVKKIEPWGNGKLKVTCTEYDLLGQVVEERIEDGLGKVCKKVSYRYDCLGNKTEVAEETAAGLSQNVTHYNSDKKPVKSIDPEGQATHIQYDYFHKNEWGQNVLRTTVTDPLGRQTITLHDALERPVSICHRNAWGILLSKQSFEYDLEGNVTRIIDHAIRQGKEERCIETAFSYEAGGQLTEVIQARGMPEQQTTHLRYNAFGQQECVTKNDGTLLISEYDLLGRLSAYYSSDQSVFYRYTYNPRHQVVCVEDRTDHTATHLEYDQRGQLLKETLSHGAAITYSYDLLSRVNTVTFPDKTSLFYVYDSCNLKSVWRVKNKKAIYGHRYNEYDLAGQNLKATAINGKPIDCQYDRSKRPIHIKSERTACKNATFDKAGRLISCEVEDTAGVVKRHYHYDDLDHLIKESGANSYTYACDSLHNRVSKNGQNYLYNGLHQILHDGKATYTYDLSGNLRKKTVGKTTTQFSYDACNRLTEVNGVRYKYDAFHRRIARIEGGKVTRFLYIGQDEIGAIDEAGKITELRVLGQGHGAEIGAAVAMELGSQLFIPSYDFRGNVIGLENVHDKSVESYRYTAFGETEIYNPDGIKVKCPPSKNPWQFCSKRLDEESGLVYFGRRYYEPENGRWITQDPKGVEEGPNLYAYLCHRPMGGFDFYGLEEAKDEQARTPIQDILYDDKANAPLEEVMPNQAPLGFEEKKMGKKSRWFYDGLFELAAIGLGRINGMMNNFMEICKQNQKVAIMGNNHLVTCTYNKSTGFILTDVIRCMFELYFRVRFASERNLYRHLMTFFEHASPDAMYFHECHSEGAIVTRNVLMRMPDAYRLRMIIAAFAPAAYIEERYCYKVTHYVSQRDIVPHFDVVGRYKCRHTTVVLKPHPDAPLLDHTIDSPTYAEFREQGVQDFIKEYGVKCA